MGVSIVIPVYNSEQTLQDLVGRLGQLRDHGVAIEEVVLVNDGSRDRSWSIITDIASRQHWIRGINLMRNYGQHNALLAGIRAARCDVTVTMDDDLQNPPEEIPRLLAPLEEGYDVVYGAPVAEQHGACRNVASRITKVVLQSAMGAETARNVSAFRAFRTRLREAFQDYRAPYVSIDVLLTWATTRFTVVRVKHFPRAAGVSNYDLPRLIAHALNMVTGFSTIPLRVASMVGFVSTMFGIGVLGLVLGRYLLQGASVPGFAFLASIVAIFAGAQLFGLGIMGEYLARLHFRMMDRPTYAVDGRTDSEAK